MVTSTSSEFVEVTVVAVAVGQGKTAHLRRVRLEEVGGTRSITIGMVKSEGDSITMHLQNTPLTRPMTYQFMAALLAGLGGQMREAHIVRVEGNTFYAAGVFDGPQGSMTLDGRPSDVINLALRTGAPIRVAPAVFDMARPAPTSDEEPQQQAP